MIEATLIVDSAHGFSIGDDIQVGDDYQRLVIIDIPNDFEITVMRKLEYIVRCGLEAMGHAVEDSFSRIRGESGTECIHEYSYVHNNTEYYRVIL